MEEKKIIGIECRFAIHIPKKDGEHDLHLVKERVHYSDKTSENRVRFIRDFKRSFAVTKQAYRNHTQKKEYEDIDKVVFHHCTQSELRNSVARALDQSYSPLPLQKLAASPFLYGSDISSTSIIKHSCSVKYPDIITPYTIGHFDTETDVIHGTNDPIMASYVVRNTAYLIADKAFYKGFSDPETQLMEVIRREIGDLLDEEKLECKILLVDGPVGIIKTSAKLMHESSPDLIGIWSIGFDVPMMLRTLEKYGVDPAEVFSDPRVPKSQRFCKYKEGSLKKITASGQVKPKNPSEQWHSLQVPAGFMFIDAMSSFRFIRQGKQEDPSYDLDYILKTYAKMSKLHFEAADKYFGLDRHIFMQTNHKLEYGAYCLVDSIGMHVLERKTNDLAISAPGLVEITDFGRLDSQTKRFADAFHYHLLEQGKVIGTIPPNEKKEDSSGGDDDVDYIGDSLDDDDEINELDFFDDNIPAEEVKILKNEVLSLKRWIVTLKPHMSTLGLKIVKINNGLQTLFRCFVYDSDAVSAYPSAASVANVCKATTLCEIIDIIGIDEDVFRSQNLNFLLGSVNALEYCNIMLKLPKPEEALALFDDIEI